MDASHFHSTPANNSLVQIYLANSPFSFFGLRFICRYFNNVSTPSRSVTSLTLSFIWAQYICISIHLWPQINVYLYFPHIFVARLLFSFSLWFNHKQVFSRRMALMTLKITKDPLNKLQVVVSAINNG